MWPSVRCATSITDVAHLFPPNFPIVDQFQHDGYPRGRHSTCNKSPAPRKLSKILCREFSLRPVVAAFIFSDHLGSGHTQNISLRFVSNNQQPTFFTPSAGFARLLSEPVVRQNSPNGLIDSPLHPPFARHPATRCHQRHRKIETRPKSMVQILITAPSTALASLVQTTRNDSHCHRWMSLFSDTAASVIIPRGLPSRSSHFLTALEPGMNSLRREQRLCLDSVWTFTSFVSACLRTIVYSALGYQVPNSNQFDITRRRYIAYPVL